MATQIKITQLTDIGSANLAVTTLLPVVNMAGVPTTQKTTLGNLANVILSQSGGNYAAVGTANIAYSVANAAQPNITSVGTLTNLAVSGNATVNGNITSNGTAYVGNLSTTGLASITTLAVGTTANLGAVGNVKITGGTGGYVLQTDGTGNLSWTAQTGGGGNGVPGGSNTQVQFNDAGSFGGNTGFTFNKTTGVFTSPFLTGNGNGLSNIAGANVSGTVGNANLSQYLDVSDVNNNFSYHVVLSAGSGDKSLHIDADDNLQYNPADGTLTATRVDATYVLADLQFSNGYPAANVTGLGNIATINLTGSNSNILYGNGVFAPASGGGLSGIVVQDEGTNVVTSANTINFVGNGVTASNVGGVATVTISGNSNQINNGNSNVSIPDASDNVYITTNDGNSKQWIFNKDGSLRIPGNIDIVGAINFPQQVSTINWSTYNIELSQYGRINTNVDFFANANTIGALYLKGDGSNISNIAVANISGLGNIATANLDGSNSNVLYGNGVFAAVAGGANTGNVTFDDVTVQGDNSQLELSAGPEFTANLAYVRVRAGDVASHIHFDTGNNEAYDLIVGNDQKFVQVSSTGNIIMSSYDGNISYEMTLDTTGNLILAGGNSVIQSIANSSSEPLYPNVSTMVFTPDALLSSQSLVLDPTGPSHIHLRAPGANIDEPDANIFLGGEDSSFEVGYYNGNVPNLYIHSGGNTWTFDTAGNLVLPQGSIITNNIPPVTFDILFQYDDLVWAGNTLTFTNASSTYMLGVLALMEVGDTIILGSTSTTVTGVYTGGGAGTFTVNGTGVGQQIAQFTLPNRLTSVNGIKLTTNAKNYLFTEVGVTQSPVLTVDTLPSGQYAVAGFRAFVSDANLAPVGNFGAIVGNSGSNTVCVWCDGTNWRIG
jgi:hypothetical protein